LKRKQRVGIGLAACGYAIDLKEKGLKPPLSATPYTTSSYAIDLKEKGLKL